MEFTSSSALILSSICGIVIVFKFTIYGIEKAIEIFKKAEHV
jgi:hypothetical protein